MPSTRLLLAAALPLLGACRPDAPAELPPRLKPLLETLPARYRPLDRQDTLRSYWAPDSLLADSLFQYTNAHRSEVLLRVRFVPASAAAAAGLDTLTFRRPSFQPAGYDHPGYHWDFLSRLSPVVTTHDTTHGVPLRMALAYTARLGLLEYRRWPAGNTYERNSYLIDYPFGAVATAHVGDSVAYLRVFPMLARQPRPDTLYTYYSGGEHRQRIPLVADQPDTTRHALLRLSFRVLHHSANLD